MDLADFMDVERVAVVDEWEKFARTLLPAAGGLTDRVLRDHADDILAAIVIDLRTNQTGDEQNAKAQGRGSARRMENLGKVHAALRIEYGFNLNQMVSEYRALRASVLRLYAAKGTDPSGLSRFNEAIDEVLAETVSHYLETTDRYRDQSLGILGHDLRNPLSAITLGSTSLLKAEDLPDRHVRTATLMLNSASRMGRMIADLLDLTRTRFGDAIPVVRTPLDLAPLCRQVVAELEGLRAPGELRFTAEGDLHGEVDADRIAQVVSNLVRNAIEHGGGGTIRLRAIGKGSEILLEVHNRGACIPESALSTIFEPLVRRRDPDDSGLGLGLYIAAQIVLAHDGKLDVTSTESDGTTFTVRLPRSVSARKAPARSESR